MASNAASLRRYFAYGANMSSAALAGRLGDAPAGGGIGIPSVLHDWDLTFNVRGHWPLMEGAFAAATPCEGRLTKGYVLFVRRDRDAFRLCLVAHLFALNCFSASKSAMFGAR
eukprot:TRINITY_DN19864_c0_g1_i2.p1 TRINITY_DN19864_c0_g1~~TRINITY_DN19864_c0_g1_i2.p1  ORF type:complete len:113 (+),score=5.53 TRINITY_DN19864_c0_g1_i2:67-405(+)